MSALLAAVERALVEHGDRPAFVIGDRSYDYHELAAAVAAITGLLDDELPGAERVGILTHDDLETYAAIFAAWFRGRTMVPIAPSSPPERNRRLLEQAELGAVLSSRTDGGYAGLEGFPGLRFVATAGLRRGGAPPTRRPVADSAIAYLLFTSGSTGVPKGVPIPHGALDAFADAFFALGHALGPGDRVLQMFELTFDLSVMSYCLPLARGACVCVVPSDGVKYLEIYRLLDEQGITCALMVPSILAHLRPFFGEIRLPRLHTSLFCGEALYDDLATEWSACAPAARVQNVYGPTEATIFCLAYDCDRQRPHKTSHGVVSIGRPMAGTEVLIVDGERRPVAPGERGELCLAGPQLTPGYHRHPEKSREAFFSHGGRTFYRTGDLVFADGDGDLFYCGRLDHQVKVQGFRVELAEVEHHARVASGIKQVAAVAVPDAAGNQLIHLFLEGFGDDPATLAGRLREQLPAYMVPARISSLAALPLNANGKIDRPALARRARP